MNKISNKVGQADWRRLGAVVGGAFVADPVSRWTLGDPDTIVATFTALGRHVYLPRGTCYLMGESGGTMWLGPGLSKDMPLLPTIAVAARLVRRSGPAAVGRALAVEAAMKAHRPAKPHLYLFAVGVAPGARGKGVGRALLAPTLAECDAAGTDAYLENSNPANTGFYRSLGFEPGESFTAAPGCPPLMPMWRAARNVAGPAGTP